MTYMFILKCALKLVPKKYPRFEKMVNLFGFTVGIHNDARSSECQKHTSNIHISVPTWGSSLTLPLTIFRFKTDKL